MRRMTLFDRENRFGVVEPVDSMSAGPTLLAVCSDSSVYAGTNDLANHDSVTEDANVAR